MEICKNCVHWEPEFSVFEEEERKILSKNKDKVKDPLDIEYGSCTVEAAKIGMLGTFDCNATKEGGSLWFEEVPKG